MEELVLNNVNLIFHALKKYNLYKVCDDYFDVGMIGLVKAAKTYSEDVGFAFSTYAMRCIENEIKQAIRKENSKKRGGGQVSISLETTVTCKGENIKLLDMIPDKFNLEDYIIKNELYEKLYKEINDLPEKNKFIMYSQFGLKDNERLTQQQIAKKLNMSQAQVNKIMKKTIKMLRNKFGGD